MKLNQSLILSVVSGSLVFASHLAVASAETTSKGALDELNSENKGKVMKGEQVAVYQDSAESPWPITTVYQLAKVPVKTAAAVFFDFDHHLNFFPNLKESKILQKIDKTTLNVLYTLRIPVVGDETSVIQDHLSTYRTSEGPAYKVDWTLVSAKHTKKTEGSARFEPLGNETLIVYKTFIVPGHTGAGLFKSQAKKAVRENATALVNRVEKLHLENSPLLENELQNLESALE